MKALPIFAILYNKNYEENLYIVLEHLVDFGGFCMSEHFYFENLQKYYSKEMEKPLFKVYLYAKNLFEDTDILSLKLKTIEIEKLLSINSKRTVNIDPGYINKQHLVLASSKERGARIHIGKNIFLEMEYIYIFKDFKTFYWTYQDYRYNDVKAFFKMARDYYLSVI
ncbi:MAG: DUF4416 family protein [Hydrogenobaculum sp.]|nr:MAG: DUF4416 domain-containing protein [Hydrogenobaculum sp.]HEK25823.1 DUF4416 family protein [Hydrogenobaculum sp.]